MRTGFSLWGNSHREKPVFITGNPVLIAGILFPLQGFPCKPLYFPVRDCSAITRKIWDILDKKLTYTANPFPVMTTGISLCSNSHREIPVMNTGSLQWEQGFPVMKTGFSLWEFTTQGKPCSGPVLVLYGIAVYINHHIASMTFHTRKKTSFKLGVSLKCLIR